jgi:hypothetical protein
MPTWSAASAIVGSDLGGLEARGGKPGSPESVALGLAVSLLISKAYKRSRPLPVHGRAVTSVATATVPSLAWPRHVRHWRWPARLAGWRVS